jgi:hypothetical protein
MKIDDFFFHEISHLTLLSKEGKISYEQFDRLEHLLQTEELARQCYALLINNELCLYNSDLLRPIGSHPPFALGNLYELAEYEKTAPAIETSTEESHRELIRKVVYPPREKRKISKFHIFTLVNVAAVLFFVLFLKFSPEKTYSVDVASLVDQLNVQWTSSETAPKTGSRLWTNARPLHLQKGIVKIHYDDGVEMLVEGPAVFKIEQWGVNVEYGRVYGRVSENGLGFTVKTPTSTFVDLGTEFGVMADVNGSSELHVFKGKVQLFADSNHDSRVGRIVTENEAVWYNANTGRIETIPNQKKAFVREVDSKTGLIWRGQGHVDLADIVGGGDGFGTGKTNWGIDTRTGRITLNTSGPGYSYGGKGVYRSCTSPLIDGVFVPDAGRGPVQISSTGLTFVECPDTTGASADVIQNGSWFTGNAISPEKAPDHHLNLDGRAFGTTDGCLYMHSNKGITFDLDAIRRTIPGLRINRFKSLAGLSDSVLEFTESFPLADFWVLVDGRLKLQQVGVKPEDRAFDIDIPLADKDRFLTLVITDSGEMIRDWAVFANPVLELELK